jgi:hypothetical protein
VHNLGRGLWNWQTERALGNQPRGVDPRRGFLRCAKILQMTRVVDLPSSSCCEGEWTKEEGIRRAIMKEGEDDLN